MSARQNLQLTVIPLFRGDTIWSLLHLVHVRRLVPMSIDTKKNGFINRIPLYYPIMSLKEMIRVTNRLLKDGVSVYLMVDGRIDEKISNYLFA